MRFITFLSWTSVNEVFIGLDQVVLNTAFAFFGFKKIGAIRADQNTQNTTLSNLIQIANKSVGDARLNRVGC